MSLKIAIDAGHGLYTSGKRCLKSLDPNQTREWYLNDRIADKLEEILKGYNCEVLRMDNITGLTDISLANRVKKANTWGADVYISIHHNAGINGGSGGGTVVYYYSNDRERLNQARALYNAVVKVTGLIGNRSSVVIKNGFYVIKNTNMPAFLLENGYMDSSTDVPVILSEDHANKTAIGLLNFLVNTFGLTERSGVVATQPAKPVKPATSTNSGSSFKVRIKVDSLNYRAGAGVRFKKKGTVKKGEIYTITEISGSWGKLKSGVGWINISDTYVTRL